MTHVSKELQGRVIAKINDCIAIASKHFPGHQFPFPRISYDQRGTTAGTAWCNQWLIKFNAIIFIENVEDFLERTVPHEFAHLVDHEVYQKRESQMSMGYFSRGRRQKRSVHGPTWQSIMRLFGVRDVTRCHSYDVTNARVKNRTRYRYVCNCGAEMQVGPKHHAAIGRGAMLTHRRCGARLTSGNYKPEQAVVSPRATIPSSPPTPRAIPAPRAGTKLDHCMQILATHKGYNREQLIDLIRRDTGMTRAGAQTYYYSAKKRLEMEAA